MRRFFSGVSWLVFVGGVVLAGAAIAQTFVFTDRSLATRAGELIASGTGALFTIAVGGILRLLVSIDRRLETMRELG